MVLTIGRRKSAGKPVLTPSLPCSGFIGLTDPANRVIKKNASVHCADRFAM
jgi:hypothetical protein